MPNEIRLQRKGIPEQEWGAMKLRLALLTAFVGLASLAALPAQELVANGGFEMNDFDSGGGGGGRPILGGQPMGGVISHFVGWNATGGETGIHTAADFDLPPRTGTFGAAFGQVGAPGSIFQIIPTVPGELYLLTFYIARSGQGDGGSDPQFFRAEWNGMMVYSVNNTGNSGIDPFSLQSFIVKATGTATRLEFFGQNDPNFYFLDDVSVVSAVPEPGTYAAGALALSAVGACVRRRKKS